MQANRPDLYRHGGRENKLSKWARTQAYRGCLWWRWGASVRMDIAHRTSCRLWTALILQSESLWLLTAEACGVEFFVCGFVHKNQTCTSTFNELTWRPVNISVSDSSERFPGNSISFYLTLQFIQQLLQLVDLRAPVLLILHAVLWNHKHMSYNNL